MRRHLRFLRLSGLVLLVLFVIPASLAAAQTTGDDDGFVFQVNTPVTIGADEVMGSVITVNADTTVDGRVKDTLWVIDSTANVNGQVEGDVIIINGTLNLASGATVKNVTLVKSTMNRADGATITGDLNERSQFVSYGWGASIFSFVFWIGTTIVILLAGLVFVALGGRHLAETAVTMTAKPLQSAVTALATWIALPILGVLAIITLIGIPLGFTILLVLMPLLLLMGYIVAGQRLGMWLAGVANIGASRYLPVLVGLLALQIIGLVPVLGGLIVGLAIFVGSGALVYHLYRNRRSRQEDVVAMEGPERTSQA